MKTWCSLRFGGMPWSIDPVGSVRWYFLDAARLSAWHCSGVVV